MSKEILYRPAVLFMSLLIGIIGFSQSHKGSFLIPQRTEIALNSSILWDFENTFAKHHLHEVLQELRLQGYIYFSNKVRIEVRDELSFKEDNQVNKLTQLKINYKDRFRFKSKKSFFKNGILVDLDLGRLQWRPRFTNTQLIFENPELYFHPQQFYGAGLDMAFSFLKERALLIHFRGHSGELINQSEVQPAVQEATVRITKFTKYKVGFEAQIGESQGSMHLVNYAHFTYKPQLDKIKFTLKAGKLPAVEETPYGVHIDFRREFKHVAIGGYFERRINQPNSPNIAGFNYSIIGPSKLSKLFRTFNISFSFNTNSLLMYIPIAKVAIQHK